MRGAVLAAGLALWSLLAQREENLRDGAQRVARCLERSDAACLYAMTSDEERLAYGLTVEKVEYLLTNYVRRHLPLERLDADKDSEPPLVGGQPHLTAVYDVRDPKRGNGKFEITVARTHEGTKSPLLVSSLIAQSMLWRHSELGQVSGSEKIAAWAKAAREDGALLRRCGFDGILQYDSMRLIGWDDWANALEHRYRVGVQNRSSNH